MQMKTIMQPRRAMQLNLMDYSDIVKALAEVELGVRVVFKTVTSAPVKAHFHAFRTDCSSDYP